MSDKIMHNLPTCDEAAIGHAWYATEAQVREHAFPPFIYVYRCSGCDGWYVRSSAK